MPVKATSTDVVGLALAFGFDQRQVVGHVVKRLADRLQRHAKVASKFLQAYTGSGPCTAS